MKTEYKMSDGCIFKTKNAKNTWSGWQATLYETRRSSFRLAYWDGQEWQCKYIDKIDALAWMHNNGHVYEGNLK